MMDLTERQKNILEIVIREYIKSAVPVSSVYIERRYGLGVSSATIRNELYELIEKGYLYQPHTSAGRVPTDKGYRFFVNLLDEREARELEHRLEEEIERMRKEVEGRMHFLRELTRFLAQTSSGLAVSYFPRDSILLREGWEELLKDPEFNDVESVRNFMEMVGEFEDNIDSFMGDQEKDCIRIYIGSEAPFERKYDFSVLVSPCRVSRRKGFFAIMGPKRMPYDKNIRLAESVIRFLEN